MPLSRAEQDFINRLYDTVALNAALDGGGDATAAVLGRVSGWAQSNLFLKGKPYSLKGYEYAQDILNDTSFDVVIGKCRQMGLSELQIAMMLSMAVMLHHIGIMFLMPQEKRVTKFVKSRIDPSIRNSPAIKSALVSGSDSATFKQIGNSIFFAGGTWSGDIISDPVDVRIGDEYDYMNHANFASSDASMDNSRFVCPHTGLKGIRRNLSTPLVPGAGVDALYQDSDRKKRLVHCKCGHWFWPEYLKHVVVDGYDAPLRDIAPWEIQDLIRKSLIQTARILCPKCHDPLPQARLAPDHRQWVAEVGDAPKGVRSGWWVSPFDLPFDAQGRPSHTPEWLLRSRLAMGSQYGKFCNHRLGIPYADETNSVSVPAFEASQTLKVPYPPTPADLPYGMHAGCDTGKTSWFIAGRVSPGSVQSASPGGIVEVLVIKRFQLRTDDGDGLAQIVRQALKESKCSSLVIDSLPYSDVVLELQSLLPGMVWAADYRLSDKYLVYFNPNEDSMQVSTHRTNAINHMVKMVNKGHVRFPQGHPELPTVKKHLEALKKIQTDPDDEASEDWVSSGDDHFAHALTYFLVALEMRRQSHLAGFSPGFAMSPVSFGSSLPPAVGPAPGWTDVRTVAY